MQDQDILCAQPVRRRRLGSARTWSTKEKEEQRKQVGAAKEFGPESAHEEFLRLPDRATGRRSAPYVLHGDGVTRSAATAAQVSLIGPETIE
jgi:hypothetical protein